jgi:hypothetical protein
MSSFESPGFSNRKEMANLLNDIKVIRLKNLKIFKEGKKCMYR